MEKEEWGGREPEGKEDGGEKTKREKQKIGKAEIMTEICIIH